MINDHTVFRKIELDFYHLFTAGKLVSALNFQQNTDNTFHHTLTVLLHYLGNSEIQIC